MHLGVTNRLEDRRGAARRRAIASVVVGAVMLATMPHAARADEPAEAPPGVVIVQQAAAPAPGPRVIRDYEEGEPIPAGYHPVERARKGLVVGGAVTFGVFYLISLLVAAGNTDAAKDSGGSSGADALYVPAIGPFVQMARTSSATANVFLAIDGLAQAGGVAMFVAGISLPKTVLVRDASSAPVLHLAPLLGRGSSGLSLVGSF